MGCAVQSRTRNRLKWFFRYDVATLRTESSRLSPVVGIEVLDLSPAMPALTLSGVDRMLLKMAEFCSGDQRGTGVGAEYAIVG